MSGNGRPEYAPTDLVTARQIAEFYGIKITVPLSWADRNRISVSKYAKSTRGVSHRLFLWSDVLALDFQPGFLDQNWANANCPRGHLTVSEAGRRIGKTAKTVCSYCATGKLVGVKVRAPGVAGKHVWFPSESSVVDWLEKMRTKERHRKTPRARPQNAPGSTTPETPAVIHPDHDRCLEARRRLWEANGRVMPLRYLARIRRARKVRKSSGICVALARERG